MLKSVTIKIKTENAAFCDCPEQELSRILKELSEKLENGKQPETLLDFNGNAVGEVTYR
jgi:hypothetical protein